jgi:hypothetical protein
MLFLFILLFLFDVGVGVLAWLGWRRVSEHLRSNPEAARLVAEHVITPLLTGKNDKPEVKKTKNGILV